MKYPALPDTEGSLSVFEQTCSWCGARFRVLATPVADGLHREEYACPECGKGYRTEAASEPQVQLLQRRTDGRGDSYQETMF
jgi:DNA-directed RNA polymerase subunit RPC12/RpoP